MTRFGSSLAAALAALAAACGHPAPPAPAAPAAPPALSNRAPDAAPCPAPVVTGEAGTLAAFGAALVAKLAPWRACVVEADERPLVWFDYEIAEPTGSLRVFVNLHTLDLVRADWLSTNGRVVEAIAPVPEDASSTLTVALGRAWTAARASLHGEQHDPRPALEALKRALAAEGVQTGAVSFDFDASLLTLSADVDGSGKRVTIVARVRGGDLLDEAEVLAAGDARAELPRGGGDHPIGQPLADAWAAAGGAVPHAAP